MKAFLERAKRKRTPEPDEDFEDGDEPTEVKLAMLASLHPGLEQEVLLDVLLAHDGSVSAATSSLRGQNQHGRKKSAGVVGYQQSMTQFAVSNSGSSPTKKKIKAKRGSTLHLYDPEDVAEHTPCTIVHNFLPQDLANDLLKELLKEAETFEKQTFKLFDNVVSSPHTTSFFVESYDEIQSQKTEYHYNGARLTVRFYLFF